MPTMPDIHPAPPLGTVGREARRRSVARGLQVWTHAFKSTPHLEIASPSVCPQQER